MSANEERYIHTLEIVSQGDILSMNNEKYIIISESITKRHGKFKAKIRHCNFVSEVKNYKRERMLDENGNQVKSNFGEPIFIDVYTYSDFIPSIVDNESFKIIDGAFLIAENRIIVTVQDNELNREKFDVNNIFDLMDLKWKVRNQDRTKRGLLILTCESD